MGAYELYMQSQELDAKVIVSLQKQMIERYGRRDEMSARASGIEWGPCHADSPDVPHTGEFIANVGGYDIYYGAQSSHFAFIMIRSNEGGDYITTNFPVNYVHGFFNNYLQ